jgi:hypothetical protein
LQCYSSESRNFGKIFRANAKCDLAILHPLFSILFGCSSAALRLRGVSTFYRRGAEGVESRDERTILLQTFDPGVTTILLGGARMAA